MEKYPKSIIPLLCLVVVALICIALVSIALHIPVSGYYGDKNIETVRLLGLLAAGLIPILFTAWAAIFYIKKEDLLIFILSSFSTYIAVAAISTGTVFAFGYLYTLVFPIIWMIAGYVFISLAVKYARTPVTVNYLNLLGIIILYFLLAAVACSILSMKEARSISTEPLLPYLKYSVISWQLFTGVILELIFGQQIKTLIKQENQEQG